ANCLDQRSHIGVQFDQPVSRTIQIDNVVCPMPTVGNIGLDYAQFDPVGGAGYRNQIGRAGGSPGAISYSHLRGVTARLRIGMRRQGSGRGGSVAKGPGVLGGRRSGNIRREINVQWSSTGSR